MNKDGDCRAVHDEDIREAFEVFQEKTKRGENLTRGELMKLLDPNNKLKEMEFKIKRHLYMKYPRPLTKKER